MLKETVFSVDVLQLTLPEGDIRTYPLDPAGGVTNIGRHSDNDIVIDGPDVKPFHFVLDHQETPFQLIALRENKANADELELVLEKIGELDYGESFEVGQHLFRLLRSEGKKEEATTAPVKDKEHLPDAAESALIVQGSSAPSTSVISDLFLTLQLPPDEWVLRANESAVYELLLINPTDEDITCAITLAGLVASSITISPKTVLLQAGTRVRVTLSCLLAKDPSNRAGIHPLTIKVLSTENEKRFIQQKIVVRVQPFYAFSVAPLEPQQQSLPFFRSHAEVKMKVSNRSNSEANFHVTGFAVGSACRFNFILPDAPDVKQANLRLAANESLAFPVRIEPPTKTFFGTKGQSYHFALRTTMLTGRTRKEPTYYTIGGHFTSQPLMGPLSVTLTSLALLLMVVFFYPQPIEQTYTWLLDTSSKPVAAIEPASVTTEPVQQWQTSQVGVVATGEPTANVAANHGLITYETMFKQIGAKYNLDWKLLASMAYRESRLDPNATGQDNDMGLMQIIPLTWNAVAPPLGVSDPYDAHSNALVGAAYLAQLRDHFVPQGYTDVRILLVAYNWGPANVEAVLQHGGGWNEFPSSTQQYAQFILQIRDGGFPPEMDALLQRLVSEP